MLAIEGADADAVVLRDDLCSGQALAGKAACGFSTFLPARLRATSLRKWPSVADNCSGKTQSVLLFGTADLLFASGSSR